MPEDYSKVEARIKDAIDAMKREKKPNISHYARRFNVPYQRLRMRWNGKDSRSSRPPTNRLLSEAQELSLCRYINVLDDLDISPLPRMVENCANSILREAHSDKPGPPPQIGEHWLSRFYLRHPEYKIRKRRAIDLDRKQAHQPEVIQDWFNRLFNTINEYGIAEEDIWNFDETGFNIGIGRDQWIVTREVKKQAWIGMNTNREYATVVETINATGQVIKPYIILSGKCILRGWCDTTEEGSRIDASETGYMNDEIAYKFIQHFHQHTKHLTKGVYRLLLCDGYGSHLTYEFMNFCENQRIIVFFLIPHTSHLLQPLDVGVFHAYKHWHSEAVANASQTGGGKFTKIEFLHALHSIREKTFKSQTIQHGFRYTGIVPFNPSIVMDQLEAIPGTPILSSPGSSHWSWGSTPKTVKRFRTIDWNLRHLERESEEFRENLNKLVKGSIAQAHLVEELRRELSQTKAATMAREQRKRASRHRIPMGGIVTSKELDRMVYIERSKHHIGDLIDWRKKWGKVMVELRSHALAHGIIQKRQRLSKGSSTRQTTS
jgi:hypothetical protein